MKKEDITSLIIYLILIAAGIITACTVIQDAFAFYQLPTFDPRLFTILTILGAILVNSICLELLHALGAKIGGYKVVSVNVFAFCFEKKEGSWKFKFSDFNGLTGETIVVKEKEKASIKPYIWLPIVGYVVEFIGMLVLYTAVADPLGGVAKTGWLAPLAIIFLVVSSMIALYNIVPLKLDAMTDGYRMVLISNPENLEAFDELMRIENLARNGEKITNIKSFDKINDFTANVNLYSIFAEISNKKFEKAIKLCDSILEHEQSVEETTYFKVLAQKIYCLLELGKTEEAKECYQMKKGDKFRRFMGNDGSIETLRSYLLIAAFIEESESEIIYVTTKKRKALENTFKTRADEESVLFENALKKVYKAHPDWEQKK